MTRKNKLFSFIAGALLALVSCNKPVDDVQVPPPPAPRLSKIVHADETSAFVYNTDGTLKETVIRDNTGALVNTLLYSYENGKVKECRNNDGKLVYSYPNANTTRIEFRSLGNQTLYSFEFKLNGNRLTEFVQYSHGTGTAQPDQKVVHTYNAAGNIVKSEHFEHNGAGWMKFEVVDVQYDSRPNYTSHLDNLFFYLGNLRILANNPVKEEYRSPSGELLKTVVYQHSFDAAGRKTRSVIRTTEPGQPEEVETVHFEY